MTRAANVVLLLAAVLLPVPLAAQGLGDTAARERQKREAKKAPAPAKVYSNQDLPESAAEPVTPADTGTPGPEGPASSSPGAPAATGAEGSAVPAEADPSEKEREERRRLEADWRVRFANARERLAVAEADSWREVVRTEFHQGIPVPMKIKEQVETEELRQARQSLADLEEEFRRTGLPPGLTRER
ncbi:MAG TPA: hypothetical protein VGB87_08740 [Vicinamibacteria bacterium]